MQLHVWQKVIIIIIIIIVVTFTYRLCTGQHADCPLISRLQHLFSSLHEGSMSSECWDARSSSAVDDVLRLWVRWLLDPEDEGARSFGALAAAYHASQRNISENDSLKAFYCRIRSLEICLRDISSSWWWLCVLPAVHKSRSSVAVATKILMVVPNIWGSSVWKLLYVTLLATSIFSDFQMFGKFAHYFFFLTVLSTYQKHLESFEIWCWRRMEKISWTDHVRNEEVLEPRSRGISYKK